jgi:hypothetical protein
MRRYVISTRVHNTARVDDMDQARCRTIHGTYGWHDEDINPLSDMKYRLGEDTDWAGGIYNQGYSPREDRAVTHRRKVIFVKKSRQALGLFSWSSTVLFPQTKRPINMRYYGILTQTR